MNTENNKKVCIKVRLSEEENGKLKCCAAACSLSQAEFIRQLCKGIYFLMSADPKRQNNVIGKTNDIYKVIDEITDYLAGFTKEERIAWFRQTMYAEPLNFIREIDGMLFAIRTFFKDDANENITEKVKRIILKNSKQH